MEHGFWRVATSWLPKFENPRAKRLVLQPIDEELTNWCRDMARQLGLDDLAEQIEVVWNPRMRTCAGRAFWPQQWIELNPKIKAFEPEQNMITLRHELAHLIAHARAGRRKIAPHGIEWRQACADLGIAGEGACHRMPLPPRKLARRYLYQCPKCFAEYARVRKFDRARACLTCCKQHSGGRYDARFRLVERKQK